MGRGDKESWRRHYDAAGAALSPAAGGRLAQNLRGLEAYRLSECVFVSPAPLLKQVRINALVDGKSLLMPAPGLHDGFYFFSPYTIAFPRLAQAVTPKGMPRYGRRLTTGQLAGLQLGLLVSEALAVDRRGNMLGDGNGFFDLAAAILAATGALASSVEVVGAGPAADQDVPADPWDVRADYRLDAAGITSCRADSAAFAWPIFWEQLPPVRIRRITPLWQLKEKSTLCRSGGNQVDAD